MLDEFETTMDVIILTETLSIEGLCHEIDGYVGYHMYRTEGTGGGVCVRSTLRSSFVQQFSSVAENARR